MYLVLFLLDCAGSDYPEVFVLIPVAFAEDILSRNACYLNLSVRILLGMVIPHCDALNCIRIYHVFTCFVGNGNPIHRHIRLPVINGCLVPSFLVFERHLIYGKERLRKKSRRRGGNDNREKRDWNQYEEADSFFRLDSSLLIIFSRFFSSLCLKPLTKLPAEAPVDRLNSRYWYSLLSYPALITSQSAWYSCTCRSSLTSSQANGFHHCRMSDILPMKRSMKCRWAIWLFSWARIISGSSR